MWNNEDVSDGSELVMPFQTDAVEPAHFEVLPDGDYPVLITKVAIKAHKSGKALSLQLNITDGPAKGRVVFDSINVMFTDADTDPKKAQAQEIGRRSLARLLEAVGKKGENNMANLAQCECIARLRTQPAQGEYEARNVVRGYKPLSAIIAAPVSVPSGQKSTPGFMQKKAASGGPPSLVK